MGQYVNAKGECVACPEGSTCDGATATENACTCATGTGAKGADCPTHDAAKCASCTDKKQCVEDGVCKECPADYTCDGTAKTGTTTTSINVLTADSTFWSVSPLIIALAALRLMA